MRATSLFVLVLALGSTIGCGDNAPANPDSGGIQPVDTGAPIDAFVPPPVDANLPDANVDAFRSPHDAGYADGGAAPPFTGAMETWQGIEVDDARCGNGSPLVVGVNLTNRSTDVVIYFQGGGACWDQTTCFGLGTASHVTETLTPADVIDEATNGTSFLFQRNAQNPYQNANYVYIPYCTGDAHAGSNVVRLGTHTMHFEGAHNAVRVFSAAHATWPTTTHVTLFGASAGGYGVIANWWRAQDEFTGARVDAISDSGLPLDVPSGRWSQMRTAWGFDFPALCTACDTMGDAMPYYATTMTPPHRFGLLAFLDDTVIPGFYGESTAAVHQALLDARPSWSATPNQRSFFSSDSGHVLYTSPNLTAGGVTVLEWVRRFATDDPTWGDVGP